MATGLDVLQRALTLLGVEDPQETPDGSQSETGVVAINTMLQRWEANGVALGFTPLTVITGTMTVAAGTLEPIEFNLAVTIAPEYGVQVPQELLAKANLGYRTLLRDAGSVITLAAGTTARQVILRALRLSNAFAADTALSYYVDAGLQTLNEMIARWQADGISITYTRLTSSATTLTCTDAQLEALTNNLAGRIASEYGKAPPAEIVALAERGYQQLLRFTLKSAGTATAADLVRSAFRLVDPKMQFFVDDGIEAFNQMLRAMQSEGPHLWRQTEGVLFITPGTKSYTLPGSRATLLTDFIETTLSADEASGQTALSVTSSAGMLVSDVIGVELDDGTRHWTTISNVNSSVLVTVASALPSAASEGATVYTYTTALTRPVRITDARRNSDGYEIPIELAARQEYFANSTKSQEGQVLQAYYSPQLTNGVLYVWPTGANVDETVRFTFERAISTVVAGTTTFDWPEEWNEVMKYKLAVRLADEYDRHDRVANLKAQADEMEANLLGWDQEYSSVRFSPARH